MTGEAGPREHLADQAGEAVAFLDDQLAVAGDLGRFLDHPVAQVLAGRFHRRQRGQELVGDAGDQLHLAAGQRLGLAGGGGQEEHRDPEHREDAQGETEVAALGAVDGGVERAFLVVDLEPPAPFADLEGGSGRGLRCG